MVEITFDIKKLKLVNIDDILANDWNPKNLNTNEYLKVKESIKAIGLNEAIKVREYEGKYQVLDGMQRFTAAKELGLKIIPIYNEGIVSDQKAREHTIWKQVQVPFNKIDEAYLVVKILEMGEPIQLPYTEIELEELKQLTAFDFDEYEKGKQVGNGDDEDIRTLSIKMQIEQYNVVMEAINKVKDQDGCTDSQAIERICADYLAGA